MCYYVQKMHKFEIQKMRAEFSKDENGTVSYFIASYFRFGSSMPLRSLFDSWTLWTKLSLRAINSVSSIRRPKRRFFNNWKNINQSKFYHKFELSLKGRLEYLERDQEDV